MTFLDCCRLWRDLFKSMLVVAVLGCTLSANAGPQRVWGYVAWWMQDTWKTLPLTNFERLIFFQIDISSNGALEELHGWPDQWTGLTTAAAGSGVALDLGLTLLEPAIFNAVFSSNAATQRLLSDALALASQPGVSGLHLDVEVNSRTAGLRVGTLKRFRSFVATLAQKLKQQSPPRSLTVFLPFGDYGAIYDSPTLARVDHAVLQGYDAHYLDSPNAGPVSPLAGEDFATWEKMLAQADKLGLARGRTVMSFPLYGYEWNVPSCTPRGQHEGKGETTTLLPMDPQLAPTLNISITDRVARYGAQVEPLSDSLYYTFVSPVGVCTVGWFEDSYSLKRKADWLEKQNLRGLAFFPLGYDQGALVNIMLQRWKR
jgi:spore germination protein